MDKDIVGFLIRAKKASYAGRGNEAKSSRPNSHDFHYNEGQLSYIDSYLGSSKFSGEEAIWENDLPIWAMNYTGRVVADGFSTSFLKDALSHVTEEYPYRGPLRYEKGGYLYLCSVKGDFHWFYGYEEIIYKDENVYQCAFHGGDVI